MKKVSGIGIGIAHYGIEYRRYSKQSIGIGIGIGHHSIVPSLDKSTPSFVALF